MAHLRPCPAGLVCLVATLFSPFVFTSSSWAQSGSSQGSQPAANFQLPPLVVTAQKEPADPQGLPLSVTTVAKPTRLEDTAALILDFESGAIGTAETGWCDGARTYDFSVHGSEGKLVNPNLTGNLLYYRPSSLVDEDAPLIEEPVDTSAWPNVHSHQHWVDCIRQATQPPLTNARTARHVTEVMLAGLASSRSGRAVDVRSRI